MEINPKKSNTPTIAYYTNLKYILSTNNPKKLKRRKSINPLSFLGNFPSKAL